MLPRQPASFWREYVIAVVILHSSSFFENVVVAGNGGNKLSNVRSIIILLSAEGLTSFTINKRINVFDEKSKMKLSGRVSFFENTRKTLS